MPKSCLSVNFMQRVLVPTTMDTSIGLKRLTKYVPDHRAGRHFQHLARRAGGRPRRRAAPGRPQGTAACRAGRGSPPARPRGARSRPPRGVCPPAPAPAAAAPPRGPPAARAHGVQGHTIVTSCLHMSNLLMRDIRIESTACPCKPRGFCSQVNPPIHRCGGSTRPAERCRYCHCSTHAAAWCGNVRDTVQAPCIILAACQSSKESCI